MQSDQYNRKIYLWEDDDIGTVEYVQHMGDDVTIVNAARVSFGKHKSEIDDKDEIYRRRFDKMQREFLKTLICDEVIEEHKNKPLGQHSEALERILYYFRRAGMNDKYVVKCEEPFKKYKII